MTEKSKTMTIEEMEKRWPKVPPFKCNSIEFWKVGTVEEALKGHGTEKIEFEVTQDSIQEIRDYLDAIEECMN